MDFKNELQRISQIIDDMPINEFEDMLFDCGLETICPSEESDFVKCFMMDSLESGINYVRENRIFLQGDYQNLNYFIFDGQEVA